MKCGNCGEISEKWQYIRLMDSVALKGGRGSASMVQKCKLCARENSIEILSSTIRSYNVEDNEKFKTIVEFECRGLEPVDFQPQMCCEKSQFPGQAHVPAQGLLPLGLTAFLSLAGWVCCGGCRIADSLQRH
ncbi:CXXC motif containing zinc binding protein isoform X3 [Pipistrellus kuhlii]|nr:CXXC motif containing zinc binding protein isoform X3 [Pipistrellus kuhlii]